MPVIDGSAPEGEVDALEISNGRRGCGRPVEGTTKESGERRVFVVFLLLVAARVDRVDVAFGDVPGDVFAIES